MGQGTKNTTSTATQTLPSYLTDAYKNLVGQASQTGSQAYTPYTGGFTQDQQTAFGNIGALAGNSNGAFGAANDAYGRSMVPTSATVGQYMSPYMDSVISAQMANMQEQNAQGQQQVVGDAISKGAMGGNRVGVAQGELARQQKLADNQALSGLYNQNYSQALGAAQADKNAALQAGQGYTGLGQTSMQTNLAQAASQLGAGTQQQQFDYQQYQNKQAYPYQQQGWLAGILGGLGSTAGGTTTQTTPQGNIFSQLLGAGLGVASLFKDGGRVPGYAEGGRVPIDMDLARNPARIMRDNPFGFWTEYDDSPRLNGKRAPQMLDFLAGGSDRLQRPMDEMQGSDYPFAFDTDLRSKQGLALGGVPYVNDNSDWPSYMSTAGSSPYSNDNAQFGSYVPKAASFGGGGNFPEIRQPEQRDDFLSKYSDTMKSGASNIKGWLTPTKAASDYGFGKLMNTGGVVGRRGYASGGTPTKQDILDLYAGMLLPGPKGGIVGGPEIPAAPPRPIQPESSYVDAANPLDGDRLGLNVNTTRGVKVGDDGLPQPAIEDPYLQYPEDAPVKRQPIVVPGGNAPGSVPYTEGTQFTTNPKDSTYSKNAMEAMQSLFGGKGLNLAPDARNALMSAGFGMMASRSPFALQGIGEGGMAGMQAWKDYQTMERENALARAGIGQKGEDLAQQAIQIGANAGLTDATANATDAATQMNQYDFRYTPYGVQVTDKTTGRPGVIYPYGAMMPNGEIAKQEEGKPPVLFSTDAPMAPPDARLMTEEGAGQALKQGTDAITTAQSDNSVAQQTQQLLQEMKHNLAQLPAEGIMAPGTAFPERAQFAKGINTYLQVFGLEPFFPEGEVAASEDLNKLTTRLGFDLSRILGSGEAASVIMNSIAAVPGGANSAPGGKKIIAGLEAANQRRIDYYEFIQKWAAKNGGSVLGADEYFNRNNPPELYALSSYVPREAMEYLRANPTFADDFNKKYGDGKNVARFVLGG